LRRQLAGHLAAIAVHGGRDVLRENWLRRFMESGTIDDRVSWTQSVGHILQSLGDEAKKLLWSSWLHQYWERRLQGAPCPLATKEASAMLFWLLDLEAVLPEAVELACAGIPNAPVQDARLFFFHQLKGSGLPGRHPQLVARLMKHVLAAMTERVYETDDLFDIVRSIRDSGAATEDLRTICEHLLRLGCSSARSLLTSEAKGGDQ